MHLYIRKQLQNPNPKEKPSKIQDPNPEARDGKTEMIHIL